MFSAIRSSNFRPKLPGESRRPLGDACQGLDRVVLDPLAVLRMGEIVVHVIVIMRATLTSRSTQGMIYSILRKYYNVPVTTEVKVFSPSLA